MVEGMLSVEQLSAILIILPLLAAVVCYSIRVPEGETRVKVKGRPEGESFSRIEQPRGELFYYINANGTKNLDRLRIRTPTFANIPTLLGMLPGMWLSDAPVVVLSIDPCISCTER
jgi:ech hydrogenase subunit E